MPQLRVRRCKQCGREFSITDGRVWLCSAECAIASKRVHRSLRVARHRQRYPEREVARQAIKNAIVLGHIRRPSRCEDCGNKCFVESHHEDYSRPFFVEWLCRTCHARREDGQHFGAGQRKAADTSASAAARQAS